ncbi:N-acetyltransferase [Yoonia sp. BS5-3]|uniref:GNAT family N-acetyltransferase n=1 Tax=Yoonia phaeophyticola TaxID=3137369 RepID=A0ABZ2V572_9RHOB
MLIRPETPANIDVIHDLTQAAFAPKAFSDGTEGPIINAMRDAGDLTLSLVAEDAGTIIGHVAFSPAHISEAAGDWYGLGPISVREDRQGQGIGRALIEAGIATLAEQGAAGCVLTGNPNIYQRIGFRSDGNLHHAGTEDRHVHWRLINGAAPKGQLRFAPALDAA